MMKTFVPAFTPLLIAAAVTGTSAAEAASRRICRGLWMQWGLIVPGSRLGEFRLGSDGTETLKKLVEPDAVDSGKITDSPGVEMV
jgi:hypothetical protein